MVLEFRCSVCGERRTDLSCFTPPDEYVCSVCGAARLESALESYGLPVIDLGEFEVDPEVIAMIPREVVEKHQIMPVNRAGSTLIVAMAHPSTRIMDELRLLTQCIVEPVLASVESIRAACAKYYP